MNSLRKEAVILIAALLMSCSTPTGYTKARTFWTSNYGYTDKRISQDEYSISVTGNSHTSREQAAEIALLRAAHITKEAGTTHFVIIKKRDLNMKTANLVSIPLVSAGTVAVIPVEEYMTLEPTAILLIRVLHAGAPLPADAIDANEVIQHLQRRFQ